MPHAWMRVGAAAAVITMIVAPPRFGTDEVVAVPGDGVADAWIQEDLASADRVAVALYDDGLGAEAEADERRGHQAAMFDTEPPSLRTGTPDAIAVFPAHQLDRPTGVVEVAVDATGPDEALRVEARGARADGGWTEWHEASSPTARDGDRITLSDQIDQVQVRIGLDGAPETRINGVRVRPAQGGAQDDVQDDAEHGETHAEPYSARLFATRIGLVGNRTANGETVRPNAHFVALPSRRGLSAKGSGEYTVRVCTTGAAAQRCGYAPVWDVGPWNIKDDHWNAEREMWTDLPHGAPQAQSAHLDGYNNGRDGFGREVRNPAGIDLADGTFWQALELSDNAWVQVDYLWTAPHQNRVRVRSADGVTAVVVRSEPGDWASDVGRAGHSAQVDVICQTGAGEEADDVWYRIGEDHYIPAVNAVGGDTAPRCETMSESEPQDDDDDDHDADGGDADGEPVDTVRFSRE